MSLQYLEILYFMMFIIFLFGALMIAYSLKQMKNIEELANGLADGSIELTPDEFLEIRNASFGGRGNPKHINRFNFSGVYVVINHTKGKYYIGQGQRVLERVYSLFVGKGNIDVFNDYVNGDSFTLRAKSVESSDFTTREELKKHTIGLYSEKLDSYSIKQYKRKRYVESSKSNHNIDEVNLNRGSSVTKRIKSIKQPGKGYIRPAEFIIRKFEDGVTLQDENIVAGLVGSAVDYLTRVSMGTPLEEAFSVSLLGATLVRELQAAKDLLKNIDGLSDVSIISACQLTGFDVHYRTGNLSVKKKYYEIIPDANTISNIRTMVKRSINLFVLCGPIVKDGFTFDGGYSDVITKGEGDFLTKDTLWDFKVTKGNITIKHTLQLLTYYIMGCRSVDRDIFNCLKYLGIFNPRKNQAYLYDLTLLSKDVISEVEIEVIGYK